MNKNKPVIMTVVGIRPDIIRLSKIIKLLDKEKSIDHVFVHTGQHYSENLNSLFFKQLGVREEDYNMKIGEGSNSLGEQLSKLMIETEKVIKKYNPSCFILLGDTNSVISSIVSARMAVQTCHIEAGMRSFDNRMPEEKNRVMCDHLSDILYVYHKDYRANLLAEGISDKRISVVGNPIVDVVNDWMPYINSIDYNSITGTDNFIFSTIHRQENIENKEELQNIIDGLLKIQNNSGPQVILTMMPRLMNSIEKFNIDIKNIKLIEPVGYFECLALQKNARMVISDSGTLSEEPTIIGTKFISVRKSTERIQMMNCGAGILSGTDPEAIYKSYNNLANYYPNTWTHPCGDGKTSERIVKNLLYRIKNKKTYNPWEESTKKQDKLRKSNAWRSTELDMKLYNR